MMMSQQNNCRTQIEKALARYMVVAMVQNQLGDDAHPVHLSDNLVQVLPVANIELCEVLQQ